MIAFAFLLAIAYVPGWTGAAIPSGWVFLSAALPLCLWHRIEMTLIHWLGLAFLGFALVSIAWSTNQLDAIEGLWHLTILAGAFALGSILPSLRSIWIGLGLGLSVSAVLAVGQWVGLDLPVMTVGVPANVAGLFFNSNILAETALLVFIGLVANRLYFLAVGPSVALILSANRTAIIVGLVVAVAALLPRWRFRFLLGSGLLVLVAAIAFILVSRSPSSTIQRIELFQSAFSHLTAFGHGPNSFYLLRLSHVHNDYLELLYEYGVGTLPLWVAMVLVGEARDSNRFVFFGFLVLSLASFPLYYPVSGFMGACVAGHLARCWNLSRADRRYRRPPVLSWLCDTFPGLDRLRGSTIPVQLNPSAGSGGLRPTGESL